MLYNIRNKSHFVQWDLLLLRIHVHKIASLNYYLTVLTATALCLKESLVQGHTASPRQAWIEVFQLTNPYHFLLDLSESCMTGLRMICHFKTSINIWRKKDSLNEDEISKLDAKQRHGGKGLLGDRKILVFEKLSSCGNGSISLVNSLIKDKLN